MIIDFNLLKGLNRTIYDALFIGLSLEKYDVRERASNFLKEDPDISRRRTILDQDLERFTNARLEFENIPDVRLSEFSDDDNKDDDNDDANTDTDADSLPSRKDFVPRTIASRSPSPISPKVVVREPATIARSTIRPVPAVVPIRTVNAGQNLWNQHGSGANYGRIEEFEAVEVCEEIGVLYC